MEFNMKNSTRQPARSARVAALWFAVAITAPSLACSLLDSGLTPEDCGTTKVPISGQWSLSGDGSRSSCNDPDRDGDISISNSAEWTVSEGSAGTTLLIDTGSSDAQIEETELNNACVSFRTREILPGSVSGATEVVVFNWDAAKVDGADILIGSFSGESTDGCVYSGDFRVDIR
jgi:hypothetical protein